MAARSSAQARDAGPRAAVVEDVEAHVVRVVVGVRPDAELRIVGERGGAEAERVAVVGAGRVGRGGDGHALQIRRRRDGELREDPALRDSVVADDGIAVIVGLAAAAEARPERVGRNGPVHESAGRLIEDREVGVDPLHVLRGADRAVGVGWRVAVGEPVVALADPREAEAGRGRGGDRSAGRGLEGAVRRVTSGATRPKQGPLAQVGRRWGRRPHVAQRRRDVAMGGRGHLGHRRRGREHGGRREGERREQCPGRHRGQWPDETRSGHGDPPGSVVGPMGSPSPVRAFAHCASSSSFWPESVGSRSRSRRAGPSLRSPSHRGARRCLATTPRSRRGFAGAGTSVAQRA